MGGRISMVAMAKGDGDTPKDPQPTNDNATFDAKAWRKAYMRKYMRALRERKRREKEQRKSDGL